MITLRIIKATFLISMLCGCSISYDFYLINHSKTSVPVKISFSNELRANSYTFKSSSNIDRKPKRGAHQQFESEIVATVDRSEVQFELDAGSIVYIGIGTANSKSFDNLTIYGDSIIELSFKERDYYQMNRKAVWYEID